MLRPALLAVAFLTRLPLRIDDPQPQQLGAAVAWFPWVGAALGGSLLAGQALLLRPLGPQLTAVVLVAWTALITGALHLDGVADVFDGAGGGRGDRSRMLEIMRDPRIGAHGASALVLVLLAKVLVSAELCLRAQPAALFVAPVCARFAAVLLIRGFPYARTQGLGRSFHDHCRARHVAIAGLGFTLAMAWAGPALIVPALVGLCVAGALGVWAQRRLGGLTGDVYGAAIELAELGVLIAARWS